VWIAREKKDCDKYLLQYHNITSNTTKTIKTDISSKIYLEITHNFIVWQEKQDYKSSDGVRYYSMYVYIFENESIVRIAQDQTFGLLRTSDNFVIWLGADDIWADSYGSFQMYDFENNKIGKVNDSEFNGTYSEVLLDSQYLCIQFQNDTINDKNRIIVYDLMDQSNKTIRSTVLNPINESENSHQFPVLFTLHNGILYYCNNDFKLSSYNVSTDLITRYNISVLHFYHGDVETDGIRIWSSNLERIIIIDLKTEERSEIQFPDYPTKYGSMIISDYFGDIVIFTSR